jgi:hypothetical protein
MTQDIIVYIILAAVAAIVIYSLVKRLRAPDKSSPCEGCSGCDLKDTVSKCHTPNLQKKE